MLGILTLDTAFPRVRGDVGNPDTFAFPVRHATIRGAQVDDIVHRRSDALLPAFVAAANELIDGGCNGIATTCGFLVRWQRELAAELEVPVLTSSLLQVPLVQRCLPRHRSRPSLRRRHRRSSNHQHRRWSSRPRRRWSSRRRRLRRSSRRRSHRRNSRRRVKPSRGFPTSPVRTAVVVASLECPLTEPTSGDGPPPSDRLRRTPAAA